MNTVGMLSPAVCLLLINTTNPSAMLTVAMLVIGIGLNGCIHSGVSVYILDVGGDLTGPIYASMNTAAQVPGIMAPMIVGYFVDHEGARAGYTSVFWM